MVTKRDPPPQPAIRPPPFFLLPTGPTPPPHHTPYPPPPPLPPLQRVTKNHASMKCYGLGLGLDTYRLVALDANFRRLEEEAVQASYRA